MIFLFVKAEKEAAIKQAEGASKAAEALMGEYWEINLRKMYLFFALF